MSERRVFRDRLDAALDGQGSVLLLGGEAGIGKTALARDFTAEAQRRGLFVLAGHCYDLTATPPYGPWLDLAASYRVSEGLPQLPDALQAERFEHITSRPALFAEIQAFLAHVASSCPTVLVLEDFHWADTASVELLRYVARGLPTLPLLVVVTYRIDEPARNQPFARHLPALIRESDGVRLNLRPLDADDIRDLVANRCELGTADESRLVAYLARRAEGNPFYVTELLRMLKEQGLLYEGDHRWMLAEIDGAPVPPLLRQVIDDRVAHLGEAMRRPLQVAAMIGQEVPLDLWATLASIGEEDVLTIIEQAIEAHLFEAGSADTRVRFVHALTREALYEGIVPPRRRQWHRQVAEALVAEGVASVDAVASHFQLARDPRAPAWLIRAGEHAQRAYAWSTAVERLAAAADLLSDVPGQEALRASLLYRCGRLQRYAQPVQGIANLAAAEALAAAIGDHQLEFDARYSRGLLRCYADDFRLGLVEMTTGIEDLEALPIESPRSEAAIWFADALPTRGPAVDQAGTAADSFLRARGVHHRRGGLPWFLAVPGRLVEAEEMGHAFLEMVAQAPPPDDLVLSATAHAWHGLGIARAALGQVQAARAAFAAARERYRQLDHHAAIAFTLLCEQRDVVLPFLTTDLDERRRIAADAEDALSRAGGALPDDVSPRRALAGLFFLEGRWAEAREVVEDTPHHGPYCLRREATGVLGPLAYAQGKFGQAWEQVNSLLPDGPTTIPGGIVLLDALLLQRLAAALCLEAGRLSEAAAWLNAHDRWLSWSGALLGRSEGLSAWAHHWLAAGDSAQARACAEEAVLAAGHPLQPLARMAALRVRGEVAAAGGDRDVAEADFLEALALADACAAPYERALTLLALAELQVWERPAEITDLLDEARAICERLGTRPALAKVDALAARMNPPAATHVSSRSHPFALTPRESDVLGLLATGHTNPEIAEALFLSSGTVRNHVSTILGKLGAHTRTEAAAIARDHNLL